MFKSRSFLTLFAILAFVFTVYTTTQTTLVAFAAKDDSGTALHVGADSLYTPTPTPKPSNGECHEVFCRPASGFATPTNTPAPTHGDCHEVFCRPAPAKLLVVAAVLHIGS